MAHFADLLPFETFEAAATNVGSKPAKDALVDAFMAFLKAKQSDGCLTPIAVDVHAPFVKDWNAFVAGRATDQQIALLRETMQFRVMSQVSMCKILAKPDLRAAWNSFVADIEAGNLDPLTDTETCRVSGARIIGGLRGWEVDMTEVVAGHGLRPARPAKQPGIVHGMVDFPTGDHGGCLIQAPGQCVFTGGGGQPSESPPPP